MGNQNSGRRPQPTALKVLRGNPGKRKPNVGEPKPPAGEVTQPAELSTGAAGVWAELAPICLAMKTLTPADVRPFRAMCELVATFEHDHADVERDGGNDEEDGQRPGEEDQDLAALV